jgi:PilZ domain-containing protein
MSKAEGHTERPAEADRRRERRPIDIRGHLMRAGGHVHAIELMDLNPGGCGIRTQTELEPGEDVKLSVLGREPMAAIVRWCRNGRAGLDFEGALERPRNRVERSANRVALIGDVSLRAAGRNAYRVRVLDLSTDGCKVEVVDVPRVGDSMRVKFEGLESLEAEVCWVEDHTAGLKFEHQLHPGVLDFLAARLGASH